MTRVRQGRGGGGGDRRVTGNLFCKQPEDGVACRREPPTLFPARLALAGALAAPPPSPARGRAPQEPRCSLGIPLHHAN